MYCGVFLSCVSQQARAEQLAGQIAGKAKQLDKTKQAKTTAKRAPVQKRDRGQDFER